MSGQQIRIEIGQTGNEKKSLGSFIAALRKAKGMTIHYSSDITEVTKSINDLLVTFFLDNIFILL